MRDEGVKERGNRKEGKRSMGYGPIKHFTDIEAWKLARELKIAVYSLIKKLPADENVEPDAEIEQKGTLCKSLG